MRTWLLTILTAPKDNHAVTQFLSVLLDIFPEKFLLVIAKSGLQRASNITKMFKVALPKCPTSKAKTK